MGRKWLFASALAVASMLASAASAQDMRIAMVVKNLGNGFFEAARDGGEEAAKELGNVELIYTGPTTPTAEGQIDIINSLIAQNVDAIVVSANDPDALVPITSRAMRRGTPVVSFDSGISADGRVIHIAPSSTDLIARKQLEMASKTIGGEGEIAILSATAQATNQNAWIAAMKQQLEQEDEFKGLKLVDVVYGDDQSDKSYREAIGLIRKHPDLKAIIAPTTVGITASAKAVTDEGLVGKLYVTGLGLPSEMAGHVHSGAVDTFAIWNPVDLGYTAVYAAYEIAKKEATGEPGTEVPVGRMGTLTIGESGETPMAEPFVYDKSNVDEYAKFF
ncbi:rhamnose ABC transporter substrate-binding protein [Consotaella aegiceratis]|uniref:rhamnose ABC transporter substrate-binding protein n=1 Tax=Consotaella aegiceratis TaxID=3097961 RepID=UPI002F3FE844